MGQDRKMREQRARGGKRCIVDQSCSRDGVLRQVRECEERGRWCGGICVQHVEQDSSRGNVARRLRHAMQGGAAERVRQGA